MDHVVLMRIKSSHMHAGIILGTMIDIEYACELSIMLRQPSGIEIS